MSTESVVAVIAGFLIGSGGMLLLPWLLDRISQPPKPRAADRPLPDAVLTITADTSGFEEAMQRARDTLALPTIGKVTDVVRPGKVVVQAGSRSYLAPHAVDYADPAVGDHVALAWPTKTSRGGVVVLGRLGSWEAQP